LHKARDNLIRSDLIAWKKPLYQVLSLENRATPKRPNMTEPLSLGELLKKAASGGVS
jgi:hypothetical protein